MLLQEGAEKICALCWAPNNTKLAVCNYEKLVILFDEQGEKRDKFATKPADPKVNYSAALCDTVL